MKIRLCNIAGDEILVNWDNVSWAGKYGDESSELFFVDGSAIRVTSPLRTIYALLDEAEEKRAKLYAGLVRLEIVDERQYSRGVCADGGNPGLKNQAPGGAGGGGRMTAFRPEDIAVSGNGGSEGGGRGGGTYGSNSDNIALTDKEIRRGK